MKHQIVLVAGTRPEVIKLAPVYAAMKKRKMDVAWVFSGQQAEIGQDAFAPFEMAPEYAYRLERTSGTLPELFGLLGQEMAEVIRELEPKMILCQGDTLTAAVAAQSGFLAGIPVGHVEAGLRSWDIDSPYPEEACRVWIDAVAALKFAPTHNAAMTLTGEDVYVTGNTVIDALKMIRKTPARKGTYAVVTLHRRENAEGVKAVCDAVTALAKDRVFDYIVWPVHPNPAVNKPVRTYMAGLRNVELVQPLPYDEMVNLVRNAKMLLTDSGGLQEEALALGVPCLVMRNETERPEGIHAGGARLVGTNASKIRGWAKWLMDNPSDWADMATAPNPYGDGRAADRIAMICKARLEGRPLSKQFSTWQAPALPTR